VDAPRTAPEVPFFQQPEMQSALRRLLYIWGIRHPASGYVQGVNDLVTPFLAVFLSEQFQGQSISEWKASDLTNTQLLDAEADAYWCLCKLVERCAWNGIPCCNVPGTQKACKNVEVFCSCTCWKDEQLSDDSQIIYVCDIELDRLRMTIQGSRCLHRRSARHSAVFEPAKRVDYSCGRSPVVTF
jgi:hypothetical protein